MPNTTYIPFEGVEKLDIGGGQSFDYATPDRGFVFIQVAAHHLLPFACGYDGRIVDTFHMMPCVNLGKLVFIFFRAKCRRCVVCRPRTIMTG